VLYRLQSKAQGKGFAREDVVMRRGYVRLSVHRIGTEGYLWRLEDLVERSAAGRTGEAVGLPMLTASKGGAILFMNDSLRRLLGGRAPALDRVFNDLPIRPGQVHEVAGIDGMVRARVA
jgi:two-component system cell cycle sensor histidine kinase/response regulator CckA